MTEDEKMVELYRLMTDELFGTISQEDGEKLSRLLQESWAMEEWHKFSKTFESQDVIDKVAQLIQEDTGAALTQTIRRKARTRTALKLTGAGAVMLLAFAGWSFLSRQHTETPVIAKGIQLQLADGRMVDLSSAGAVTAGHATIHNDTSTHTISYTVPEAAGHTLNTLQVPVGMDYHIRLSDGTEVFLNAATKLSFPFTFEGPRREITIHGEAFLKIARRAGQPFIVHLPGSDVEVLGTSFNVNSYDTAVVKVSLQEGAVQLHSAAGLTRLTPGSQAVWHAGNQEMQVQPFSPDELSWMRGAYILDNTPLAALATILPRWFGIEVMMDSKQVAAERFTGTLLKTEPIDTFLKRLERTAGVTTYYKEGVLHIK